MLLVIALPATEPFAFPALFPVWQSLALLTLHNRVAGEEQPEAGDSRHAERQGH